MVDALRDRLAYLNEHRTPLIACADPPLPLSFPRLPDAGQRRVPTCAMETLEDLLSFVRTGAPPVAVADLMLQLQFPAGKWNSPSIFISRLAGLLHGLVHQRTLVSSEDDFLPVTDFARTQSFVLDGFEAAIVLAIDIVERTPALPVQLERSFEAVLDVLDDHRVRVRVGVLVGFVACRRSSHFVAYIVDCGGHCSLWDDSHPVQAADDSVVDAILSGTVPQVRVCQVFYRLETRVQFERALPRF
jgi:hypothetical protein